MDSLILDAKPSSDGQKDPKTNSKDPPKKLKWERRDLDANGNVKPCVFSGDFGETFLDSILKND
jgi:hypothetical protein